MKAVHLKSEAEERKQDANVTAGLLGAPGQRFCSQNQPWTKEYDYKTLNCH